MMRRVGLVVLALVLIVAAAKVYESTRRAVPTASPITTTTCPTLNCQVASTSTTTTLSATQRFNAEQAKISAEIAAGEAAAAKAPVVNTVIAPPTPTTLPYCTPEFINPLWNGDTYCAPNASDPPYYCPDMQLTPVQCAQLYPSAYRP